MEKNSDNLLNFSNLPVEIQQHIASYLDSSGLGFFTQSSKQTLKNLLPLLVKYQAMFPLQLTASQNSVYIYQANQLFVCGRNDFSLAKLGNTEYRSNFSAVSWPEERGKIEHVIAGGWHTVVLTQDNRLWVSRLNNLGQLGLGYTENCHGFTAVPLPSGMGKVKQVVAGWSHILVLTESYQLCACGENFHGQLGLEHIENCHSFNTVPLPSGMGKVKQVVAGGIYTLVVTEDHQLWACGANSLGQLGLGYTKDCHTLTAVPLPSGMGKMRQVVAGSNHTVVLTEDNRLWVCGRNDFGQLGLGHTKDCHTLTAVPLPSGVGKVKQVLAGGTYTLIVTEDDQLWACGDNRWGQLGLEGKEHRSSFTAVLLSSRMSKIKRVVVGLGCHTLVVTTDYQLWVCGDNEQGQLGLGDKVNRSAFTPVNMKTLSPALQELFILNHTFHQLIKLGKSLMLTSKIESSFLYNQLQPDEPEDQPPLKKMRL